MKKAISYRRQATALADVYGRHSTTLREDSWTRILLACLQGDLDMIAWVGGRGPQREFARAWANFRVVELKERARREHLLATYRDLKSMQAPVVQSG